MKNVFSFPLLASLQTLLITLGTMIIVCAIVLGLTFSMAKKSETEEAKMAFTSVTSSLSDTFYAKTLSNFIADLRVVSNDRDFQQRSMHNVYMCLNRHDLAFNKILHFYRNHNPFERSINENVSVEVTSITPKDNNTWVICWKEECRNLEGEKKYALNYEATATLYSAPAPNMCKNGEVVENPDGIFVRDISWASHL